MSYGITPSPAEAARGTEVWDVVSEATENGVALDIDDIADEANIAPHLPQETRRAYARSGVHWARVMYQRSEHKLLKCDRRQNVYYLTDAPDEVREYSDDIVGGVLTTLRTLREALEGVPANTKIIRIVRKVVDRLIQDIEDDLTGSTP